MVEKEIIVENHIQTVIAALAVALLAWVGYTTHQTALAVTRLEGKIENIQTNSERIDRLDARIRELEILTER